MSIRSHDLVEVLRTRKGLHIAPAPRPGLKSTTYLDRWLPAMADAMGRAEHFVLPEEVLAWDVDAFKPVMDSAAAMVKAGLFRLPYQVVVIQIKSITILVTDTDGGLYCTPLYRAADGSTLLVGNVIALKPEIEVADGKEHLRLAGEFGIGYEADSNVPAEDINTVILEVTKVVTALIVMLNSRGIGTDRVEPPAKLNKARERKGRPCIPAYTNVTLRPVFEGERTRTGGREDGDGTRRAPRIHWRRGHVSHRWGEPRWIQPVLVGVRYQGERDYVPHGSYRLAG